MVHRAILSAHTRHARVAFRHCPPRAPRTLGTLLLAWLAARAAVALGLPVPWMIGPLLATALATLAGAPTHSEAALRNAGQWAIGAALGLYFTPEVTRLVLSLWWAVALGIGWALLLSVPLAMQWAKQHWQLQALDVAPPAARVAEWPGVLWLALATGAGAALMRLTGRANPWFIGALLAAMGLTMADVHLSSVPTALTNAAQLVIGVSLGVRFTLRFLQAAPRWLAAAALGTLAMIGASALFGAALAWASGLHPVTLMLATAPGGIAEMAITAKVLQLGVAVVTAFQVCRLVAVLLAEPIYRRWVMPRK